MTPVPLWLLSCAVYRKQIPFLPRLLKTVIFLVYKAILPFDAEIQRDIHLEHYGLGLVIHPNVIKGYGVRIYHQVTVAAETWIGSPHRIFIGNNVTIGAGAIILARSNQSLRIGAGAYVGAGSVVTGDVSPGQTVVGCPARPIAGKSNQAKTVEDMTPS